MPYSTFKKPVAVAILLLAGVVVVRAIIVRDMGAEDSGRLQRKASQEAIGTTLLTGKKTNVDDMAIKIKGGDRNATFSKSISANNREDQRRQNVDSGFIAERRNETREHPEETSDPEGNFPVSEGYEQTIAYADDTGLELKFFDDSNEVDSSQNTAEQDITLHEQMDAYQTEINKLKFNATENNDPEKRKLAIESLVNHEGEQAAQALIDIALNTENDDRVIAAKGLIKKLQSGEDDHQQIVDTLTLLSDDSDGDVADVARQAISDLNVY